jgi:hypothetical protein
MITMTNRQVTYRIEVDFIPVEGLSFNNAGDDLPHEEYLSSLYVRAYSTQDAMLKFMAFMRVKASHFKLKSKALVVGSIEEYPMDSKIIKSRHEEGLLDEGNVVFGWIL